MNYKKWEYYCNKLSSPEHIINKYNLENNDVLQHKYYHHWDAVRYNSMSCKSDGKDCCCKELCLYQ